MRRAGAAILLLGLALDSAHAQDAATTERAQEIQETQLRELKLDRLKQVTLEKTQLLKAGQSTLHDPTILKAFEQDLARFSLLEAMESLRVRQVLADTVQLAADPDIAESLEQAGYSVDGLRKIAGGDSLEASAQLAALELRFGRDKEGRITLGRSSVMIVRPQPMFPDNVLPGVVPNGQDLDAALKGNRIEDMVWRSGLTYAGALTASGPQPVIRCSGTIVARQWLVTAAHCLAEISPDKPPKPDSLRVYLPFQGGTEQVLTVTGHVNRNMKAVRVDKIMWIGEEIKVPYPVSEQAISELSSQGTDIALLRLSSHDVSELPNPIGEVRLATQIREEAHSLVGYGLTDRQLPAGLSLLVGMRPTPPSDDENVLYYGPSKSVGNGGICNGDSGGGAFAGRINGTQLRVALIGVISALLDSGEGTANICFAGSQMLSSVVSARNRAYMCKHIPDACRE